MKPSSDSKIASDFHPGELVMVGIRGKSLDAGQAEFLRRNRIRAVVLFRDNLGSEEEVRELIGDLHDVLGPRALIGVDQEGGAVVRATFLPQPPAAASLLTLNSASAFALAPCNRRRCSPTVHPCQTSGTMA